MIAFTFQSARFGIIATAFLIGLGISAAHAETRSPTLGAAPPPGAVVLFDGSGLGAWLSQKDRQWETSDGPADWKLTEEGALEVVPGAGSLISKQQFGDFELHAEVRLLGEKTNGGIFLMCRYELGISDSGDGRPWLGGFDNLRDDQPPITKPAAPDGKWQAFDVDFRAPRLDIKGKTIENARATVYLNGILIHDDVELGARKGAAKRLGDAARAPLMLQEHGSRYRLRNIWLAEN